MTIKRYIFTTHRSIWSRMGDYAAAIVIGLILAALALAYFDVLVK